MMRFVKAKRKVTVNRLFHTKIHYACADQRSHVQVRQFVGLRGILVSFGFVSGGTEWSVCVCMYTFLLAFHVFYH